MCLCDTKRFRFTFKRILVYKIALVDNTSDTDVYLSPYIKTAMAHRMMGRPIFRGAKYNDKNCLYSFDAGFIHAYTSDLRAFSALIACNMALKTRNIKAVCTIVEGYIPAFTRYALDNFDEEICAKRMVFPKLARF